MQRLRQRPIGYPTRTLYWSSKHVVSPVAFHTSTNFLTVKRMSTSTAIQNETINNTNQSNKDKDKDKDKDKNKHKQKDDNPNLFLDNLGKIFFAVIASIILALIRSSRGSTNRTNVKERMEKQSILDPCEIDDLRFANSEFTIEVFHTILDNIHSSFPTGESTYDDFLSVVIQTMKDMKGEQFTIEFGYLLDRVVIGHLKNQPSNPKLPIPLLLTILSLALNSSVSDRISILYQILTHNQNQNLSEETFTSMIDYLQLSCQLPHDPQILTSDVKYPVQEYKVGTPKELFNLAKNEIQERDNRNLEDICNIDDFKAILGSTYVCAWGECYGRKR